MADSASVPSFTLKYVADRRELSNWYRRSFFSPRGLWGYWAITIAAIVAVTLAVEAMAHRFAPSIFVIAGAAVLLLLSFFVLFPQATYKRLERTLIVSDRGIETTIGGVLASRSWRDVAAITDYGETIAVVIAGGARFGPVWIRTLNGNAFVIPNRAFEDPASRSRFLEQIMAWHAAQRLRFPRFAMERYYAVDPETELFGIDVVETIDGGPSRRVRVIRRADEKFTFAFEEAVIERGQPEWVARLYGGLYASVDEAASAGRAVMGGS